MYKVKLGSKAKKELKIIKISHGIAVQNVIDELKDDPFIGKPLSHDLTNHFSYKLGLYRIIYRVNKESKVVTILTAAHRSIVYH